MIPKNSESKYVSASLLTWRSAMSSIILGPFRLLGNAHLFRWPVGLDMWCRSCRPEVRIRRRVHEKIWRISNLLNTFECKLRYIPNHSMTSGIHIKTLNRRLPVHRTAEIHLCTESTITVRMTSYHIFICKISNCCNRLSAVHRLSCSDCKSLPTVQHCDDLLFFNCPVTCTV